MTLRDLTPRQRDLLLRRCSKNYNYWKNRLAQANAQSNPPVDKNHFQIAFNAGVVAVLEILMPK